MKKKHYVWLSLWLSLGLVVSSCGTASTRVEASAPPSTIPKVSLVGEALKAGQDQIDHAAFLKAHHEAEVAAAQKAAEEKRQAALRAAEARRKAQAVVHAASASGTATAAPTGVMLPVEYDHACGGKLPPCSTLNVESGGNIRVWNGGCFYPAGWSGRNRCGSTASGKWQFVRSTWANFMGYLNAADAPAWVQNLKAEQTWAGGCGAGHWGKNPKDYGC